MKKPLFLLIYLLFALFTTACSSSDAEPGDIPKSQAVSIEAVTKSAKGFIVGSAAGPQTVYVFFDAQCPHCGHLWESAKPLWPKVQFQWIPVAFLNKASLAQGATLLGADNPELRMNEHETSLLARQGGISAGPVTAELKAAIEKNTRLLSSFGATSIPYIVAKKANGELVAAPGAPSTNELIRMLSLPPMNLETSATGPR